LRGVGEAIFFEIAASVQQHVPSAPFLEAAGHDPHRKVFQKFREQKQALLCNYVITFLLQLDRH
jgi:hypothetical protein